MNNNTNTIKYENGILIFGDSLKRLKELRRKKTEVDAIITDPPYNISRKNNFNTIGRKGIDFGKWDKGFDQLSWISIALPVLKKGGNIIIFNDWKNMGLIARELERLGCKVKDLIRWIKRNPMPRNIERRYVTDFEFAIWATKGDGWTFNRLKKRKYMRPEYKTGLVLGKKELRHPTQKSLKLMENIVLVHTNENDVVLDPFIGSGTTLIACENTKRKWIGVEKDRKYFEISKGRLDNNKNRND